MGCFHVIFHMVLIIFHIDLHHLFTEITNFSTYFPMYVVHLSSVYIMYNILSSSTKIYHCLFLLLCLLLNIGFALYI